MPTRKKAPKITPGDYEATFIRLVISITDELDLKSELWFRLDDGQSVAWVFDSIPFLNEPLPESVARLLNEPQAISDLKDLLGRQYTVRVEHSWSGKDSIVTKVNSQIVN
jgi:hypothetical protein